MAITISNLSIGNTALAGTPIGVLTTTDASGTVIPCNYMLAKGSIGYFAIAGNDLVSAWTAPATPGHYSVRIRATGSDTMFSGSATFTIDVGTAAPPPPPLPSIQIIGSTGPVKGIGRRCHRSDCSKRAGQSGRLARRLCCRRTERSRQSAVVEMAFERRCKGFG